MELLKFGICGNLSNQYSISEIYPTASLEIKYASALTLVIYWLAHL